LARLVVDGEKYDDTERRRVCWLCRSEGEMRPVDEMMVCDDLDRLFGQAGIAIDLQEALGVLDVESERLLAVDI
jgi:hypothetical protein